MGPNYIAPWMPSRVTALGNLIDIAAAGQATCALEDTGLVKCWGFADLSAAGARSVSPRR